MHDVAEWKWDVTEVIHGRHQIGDVIHRQLDREEVMNRFIYLSHGYFGSIPEKTRVSCRILPMDEVGWRGEASMAEVSNSRARLGPIQDQKIQQLYIDGWVKKREISFHVFKGNGFPLPKKGAGLLVLV